MELVSRHHERPVAEVACLDPVERTAAAEATTFREGGGGAVDEQA